MSVYGPLTLDAAQWGRERILLDRRDVSWWRGFHTVLEERDHAVPFGYRSCSIYFPQATGHETLGVGDTSMLRRGVNIDIQRIKPDGTIDREFIPFEGFVTRVSPVKDERSYGIRVECVGYLYQGDHQVRTPHELGLRRPLVPLGWVLSWTLNHVRARRYKVVAKVNTPGVKTRKRGSMSQSPLNFAAELCAESWDKNGDRWTVIDKAPGRRAHIVKKKKLTDGVDYTISYGAQGISVEAVDDLTERCNVIFGSGIRPDGGAWSNYFYPGFQPDPVPWPGGSPFAPGDATGGFKPFSDLMRRASYPDFGSQDTYRNVDGDIDDVQQLQRQAGLDDDGIVGKRTWDAAFRLGSDRQTLRGGRHLPLAWDPRVEPYLYNAHGQVIGDNPKYNPSILRVEKWVDYGAGVTKRDARRSARREVHVTDDPAWIFTVTLRTNPEECHRNKMRSNRILRVKHFAGGVNAYITDVSVRNDGSVQVNASTQLTDYMTLAAIKARDKDGRADPARGILRRASRGRTSFDQAINFDAESPMGHMPPAAVTGGSWHHFPIPFGGWGTIVKAEFHTNPAAQYWVGVFADNPSGQLATLVGNPATSADKKPWDINYDALTDIGLLMAYGRQDSPMGYGPREKTDSTPPPPLTGDYTDQMTWEWATDPEGPPVLHVAIWADRDTTFSGRFFNAPQAL